MNGQTGRNLANEEIILDDLGKLLYEDSDSLFKKKKRSVQIIKTISFLISLGGFVSILIMWIRGTLFQTNSFFCIALSLFWSILLIPIVLKMLLHIRTQKFQIFDTGIQFSWGAKRFLPFSEVKNIQFAKSEPGVPSLQITKSDDTFISIGNYKDGGPFFDTPWREDVEDIERITDLIITQWKIKTQTRPPR